MGQYWILRPGICGLSVGLALRFEDVTDDIDAVEERELERGETLC